MVRRFSLFVCAALLCAGCWAAEPEVDRDDVLRRGDSVEHVTGGDIRSTDEFRVDIDDPLAPPPSDAHKWFISVVYSRHQGQRAGTTGALTGAFRSHPELHAFANPDDHKQSWAHFSQYAIEDQSQQWRFGAVKFSAFPTVIVQPPRTGQFGDSGIVVCQAVYDGDPAKLAGRIRDAIKRYVGKLQQQRQALISGGDPLTPGPSPAEGRGGIVEVEDRGNIEQCPGPYCPNPNGPPPWEPTPKVVPDAFPNMQPYPNGPVNLPGPFNIPPDDGGGCLGGGLLELLLGGGLGKTFSNIVNLVLYVAAGGGVLVGIRKYLLPHLGVPSQPAAAPTAPAAVPAVPVPAPVVSPPPPPKSATHELAPLFKEIVDNLKALREEKKG